MGRLTSISSVPPAQRGSHTQVRPLEWMEHVGKQFGRSGRGEPSAVAELVEAQLPSQDPLPNDAVGRSPRRQAHQVAVNGQDLLGGGALHQAGATGAGVGRGQHASLEHEGQGGGAVRHGERQRDRLRASRRDSSGQGDGVVRQNGAGALDASDLPKFYWTVTQVLWNRRIKMKQTSRTVKRQGTHREAAIFAPKQLRRTFLGVQKEVPGSTHVL